MEGSLAGPRCGLWLLLAACLLLCCPSAQAQGTVEVREGEAKLGRPPQVPWKPVDYGDLVQRMDQLRTEVNSKLEVLFDVGHRLLLGPSCQVIIGSSDEVILDSNNPCPVRVNRQEEASPGSKPILVQGPTAQGRTSGSGFIACCGRPQDCPAASALIDRSGQLTRQECSSACLFVGVYGSTDVESLDASPQKVKVESRRGTVVCQGKPPLPPQPMPEIDYLDLIDLTTIVGTGARLDQVGMTDPAIKPAASSAPDASPGLLDVELQIGPVDQPMPDPLPEPPKPPRPKPPDRR